MAGSGDAIQEVQQGDPITADGWNQLVRGVNSLSGLGDGQDVIATAAGMFRRKGLVHKPPVILLGKTDEAITGKSATTGTVSLYFGTPSSNTDTTINVECEAWVDIDSGIYVNVLYRYGGWECYPLECNA